MRARTVITVLAALALASSLALAVPAEAFTSTTQPTQTFTSAGTYYVTVPHRVGGFELDGVGGAGYAGDPSSTGSSKGGAGGSGTHVHVTFNFFDVDEGEVLKVVVGAKGGGGQRGYGSDLSGSGGNGGGATTITNAETGEVLLVAGGGGGGGGGGSLGIGFTGGRGGTGGNGTAGTGTGGGDAGRGGALGQATDCTQVVGQGGTGESAPTASAVAGGGGGGQGACGGGGQSGGSGDHAAGEGGGGGGGAGASYVASYASSPVYSAGDNSGDGSASITFTTKDPLPPTITTPNCMYVPNPAPSTDVYVTGYGDPLPTITLLGGPSWLLDEGSAPYFNFIDIGSILTLQLDRAVAPGQYRAQVEAMNEGGSVVEPLTLVAGADHPVFLSPDTATATAGSPFAFQVQAVGCPPILYYAITAGQNDVPWLTIDPTTGELSGTPSASDVGTHTITVQASTGGVAGTPITQTLTVQVDPAAVTPPPVTTPPVTTPPVTTPPVTTPPVTTPPTSSASSGSTPPGGSATGSAPAAPKSMTAKKPSADLSVHLSGPATVRTGRTFTETLTVTNHGPHTAARVHLALRYPRGFTVSDAAGATRHGRALRWGIPALAAHATRTYTLTFEVVTHRRAHHTFRAAVRSLAAHDRNARNNHRNCRLLVVPE